MIVSPIVDRADPFGPNITVATAAAALDEAFGHHAPRLDVVHCPHCVSAADLEELAQPVASISAATASRFVRKVGTTWGDADDLRRLVPRLLPLAADHRLEVDRALLFRKLRWARWSSWSHAEVNAVQMFLAAEWNRLLRATPRPAHSAHRWLADVGAGLGDLVPFLTRWHDAMGPLPAPEVQQAAVGHLVELLTNSPLRPDLPDTMANVFPGNQVAVDQVTAWLVSPGTLHEMRRAAAEAAHTPRARRTNVALERLRRYSAAVTR